MSAICPSCGASLPEGAAACAECGAQAPTVAEPLPPVETGPGPVRFDAVTPRWFGVAPAGGLLALAGLSLVAAVLLFALGPWPVGLVLVGLTLLFLAAFGETAKRKPADSRVARRSLEAFRAARERAGFAVGAAAARTRAQRELARLRHELLGIRELRRQRVAELGEAALTDDRKAIARLKEEIGGLDELTSRKEAEMQTIASTTQEDIAQARFAVQQTVIAVTEDPSEAPHKITSPKSRRS